MPYIKAEDRVKFVNRGPKVTYDHIFYEGCFSPSSPGELNYLITKLCTEYKERKGLSYATINDIVGALEGAKLEFYRRVAAPYEDMKKQENGDVY